MSKISLFNKGIYKSTLSRFKWGSVLYFVILFFSTCFPLMIDDMMYSAETVRKYLETGGKILNDSYIGFPVFVATIVPTVVGFLAFDMFWSKQQSVFVHSLPCKRRVIYFSVLSGAFTLMVLPVLANALILMIISASKFGEIFGILHCLKWILANLILLFVMFSIATLSASITSSRIGYVFVNGVLHFIPFAIAFCIGGVASAYLYGFDNNLSPFFDSLVSWLPAFSHYTYNGGNDFSVFTNLMSYKSLIYISCAVLLYVVSFFIYKKRHAETAGNFVAFKVLNPVFKYLFTALGTVFTFSLMYFGRGYDGYALFVIFVVSIILYFAFEMILKKNLKVFGTYKGYLVFAAVMAVLVVFVQFTSFFGYENRVPEIDEVESVLVSEYYEDLIKTVSDRDFIAEVINIHENKISEIPLMVEGFKDSIKIEYNLKNGKKIKRVYRDLTWEEKNYTFGILFNHKEYRLANDMLHQIPKKDIEGLSCSIRIGQNNAEFIHIDGAERTKGFIEAWQKDIENLGYKERNKYSAYMDVSINFKNNVSEDRRYYRSVNFNSNFKNTLNFLEQNWYFDPLYYMEKYHGFITKEASSIQFPKGEYSYEESEEIKGKNYTKDYDEVLKISKDDFGTIMRGVIWGDISIDMADYQNGEYYIFYISEYEQPALNQHSLGFVIPKNNVPQQFAEYVE